MRTFWDMQQNQEIHKEIITDERLREREKGSEGNNHYERYNK